MDPIYLELLREAGIVPIVDPDDAVDASSTTAATLPPASVDTEGYLRPTPRYLPSYHHHEHAAPLSKKDGGRGVPHRVHRYSVRRSSSSSSLRSSSSSSAPLRVGLRFAPAHSACTASASCSTT